jgi:hypothetical protein
MAQEKASVRKSKITIPAHCDPRAKVVFAEMRRQAVTYDELEWRSGVLRSTFKAWRKNSAPGIHTVDAALGALGWSLLPVPTNPDAFPADLRADLESVAKKHGRDTLPCLEFIAACIGHRHPGSHIDARERRAVPC